MNLNRAQLALNSGGSLSRVQWQPFDPTAGTGDTSQPMVGESALRLQGCSNLANDVITCNGLQIPCECIHMHANGTAAGKEHWCCDQARDRHDLLTAQCVDSCTA